MRPARKMLGRSLAVARRQEAAVELKQTLNAVEMIGSQIGWRDHKSLRKPTDQELLGRIRMPDQDRVDLTLPSLSLLDRFDSILEEGRKVDLGAGQASNDATLERRGVFSSSTCSRRQSGIDVFVTLNSRGCC